MEKNYILKENRLSGSTELFNTAFQSYIRLGIIPNIRRSDTFLLSQSVQQSLPFSRNLLSFLHRHDFIDPHKARYFTLVTKAHLKI